MEYVLGINEILKILPHRYPFLFVDGVINIEPGEKITAVKNYTINEIFFQGHFPKNPVVPGVLIIEALAQTAAIMNCYCPDEGEETNAADKVGYLAKVSEFKFKKLVKPGEQLVLHAQLTERFSKYSKVKVWAETDRVVAQGILLVTNN